MVTAAAQHETPPERPAEDQEPKGGWWATEEETRRFLNLETLQEVFDLVNRKLTKRRCARIIDERDIQRLGPRKFRVWCCKPDAAGQRRPRLNERGA